MRVEICSSIGLNPLLLRELSRENPTQATVGPDFVVVLPPLRNALSGLGQTQEPLLVQALVPKLAVKALEVAVLHRPAWLSQYVPHVVCAGPSHEGPACELRTVIRSHSQWVASNGGRLVEQACDVLPRDPLVHGNVHALVAEVICQHQAPDAPVIGQAVRYKIHTPQILDLLRHLQVHPLAWWALDLLVPAHGQIGIFVQAVDPLMVDARKLRAQQIVDAPIAKCSAYVGNVHDALAQGLRQRIALGWVAKAVSA